jgi:hypothetical protein
LSVKGYVNCVSMPEYGLDCQSRRSKSCVVNDGSLSTEVLRVAIWVPKYKKQVVPFSVLSRSKEWPKNRADGRGNGRDAQITVPTSHSIFQQRDHSHTELCFKLCISTGEWALSAFSHCWKRNYKESSARDPSEENVARDTSCRWR